MSRDRGSPRGRYYRDTGRRTRGNFRRDSSLEEKRGRRSRYERNSRRKRSISPVRSLSRSPSYRSPSPRKRNSPHRSRGNRYDSRSPRRPRNNRRQRVNNRSPVRGRRTESPLYRNRRNGRPRFDRRPHGRSSSTSRSPVPVRRTRRYARGRSSRRRNYRSSSSSSSSDSNSSWCKNNQRPPAVYRVGDEVECKKYSRRSMRAKWVSAEVEEVWRTGVNGELTYTVWLTGSGRTLDCVPGEQLRFKNPQDFDVRLREDEIARWQEDMRQINLKLARLQRDRILSPEKPQRVYYPAHAETERAQSVDGAHNLTRSDQHEQRAFSLPPDSRFCTEFIREFKKLQRGIEDKEFPGREETAYTEHLQSDNIDEYTHNNKGTGNLGYRSIVGELQRGGGSIADHVEVKSNVERISPQNYVSYPGYPKAGFKQDTTDQNNVYIVKPSNHGQYERVMLYG